MAETLFIATVGSLVLGYVFGVISYYFLRGVAFLIAIIVGIIGYLDYLGYVTVEVDTLESDVSSAYETISNVLDGGADMTYEFTLFSLIIGGFIIGFIIGYRIG